MLRCPRGGYACSQTRLLTTTVSAALLSTAHLSFLTLACRCRSEHEQALSAADNDSLGGCDHSGSRFLLIEQSWKIAPAGPV